MPVVIQGAIAIGGNVEIGFDVEVYRNLFFDSRNPPAQGAPVSPVSHPAWNGWMQDHAVNNGGMGPFDRTYTLTFPVTGKYEFKGSVDDNGWIDLDGVNVFQPGAFAAAPKIQEFYITAGSHTIALHSRDIGGVVTGIGFTIRY